MQNLIEGLNDKQKEAVEFMDGPCLVLAGAGSGKTTTIIGKIKYLILKYNVLPEEILVLSFTIGADKEMKG